MNKRLLSFLALIVLIGASSKIAPALAATTPPATTNKTSSTPAAGQALEIAPPVITLTANPGETTKTQVFLRNISGTNLVVSNQVNDFVARGEDGTPKLLLDNKETSPYTIKDWIGTLPNLTLIPKEIRSLPITINVPANASPGGHYGVVRFTGTPAGLSGQGVSLSASLGALILITVNGNISESLSVQEFSASGAGGAGSIFESAPIHFVEKLKNTGNVHVKPVGQVTITNMFGKKVAAVNVNLPPGNILPQSVRKFDQPLDKTVLGTKKLFGRYKADLKVTYGTGNKTLTDSLTFWVIPYKLIITVALLLVGAFFAIRYLIKLYNKRIIDQARKSQNKQ